MDSSTQERINKIKRYFEPELVQIPQKQNRILQIQQSAGNNSGPNVAGGVAKGVMSGVSLLTTMMGAAAGVNTRGLTKAFDVTGDIINKGIKTGGNALNKSFSNAETQRLNAEIQKILNGDVNRGMTDEYFDLIVCDLVPDDSFERAIYRLNLDESQISEVEPVYIEDYFVDSDNENQLRAKGRDGKVRTQSYQSTWLFGTAQHLGVYQYTVNLLSGGYEETDNLYFWRKITQFSNASQNDNSTLVIRGANFEYKFSYQDSPQINNSIRGMKSIWNMNG